MGLSLEELLGNVNSYRQGAEAATQKVLSALDAQAGIQKANVDTFTQQATDDRTVQEAKNAADYATQLARVKAANAFGTNLKSDTEVITKLSAAAEDAYNRKAKALSNVQHNNEISFLDHPIDFIIGQLKNGQELFDADLASQQLNAAQDRIQAINLNTQSTITTQNAISEPLTAASMEASARSAAVTATVNARSAQIQGLSYGVQGVQFALNAKKDVLATEFQLKQAQNADASLALSQKGYELQVKSFEQQTKEFNQREQDKQDQLAIGKSVVDRINIGRYALLGDKAQPLDDVTGKMVIAAMKSKSPLSAELQKYYDAGERTMLNGTPVIGSTPAAAADTLQTVPVKLNPTQGPIKAILGQAAQDTNVALRNAEVPGANKNPVFVGIDKKDKNSINSAYNARAQQILNDAAKVVKPGDADNPYQIGSINQLAANSPTVQALSVYQKVLEPLVKSGVILSDPKQVMQLVGDAVSKGTITHKQAVELTTIYHVGVTANMAMRNFEGFGLKPYWGYNAKVTTDPTAWHTDEVVDMTKPDAVSRALVKLQAGKLRQHQFDGSISEGPFKGSNEFFNGIGSAISNGIDFQAGPKINFPKD